MMLATFRFIGHLKSYGDEQGEIYIEPGQTVREALRACSIPSELVALVLVGDQPQNKDYVIQEGDLIRLMAVTGGG